LFFKRLQVQGICCGYFLLIVGWFRSHLREVYEGEHSEGGVHDVLTGVSNVIKLAGTGPSCSVPKGKS